MLSYCAVSKIMVLLFAALDGNNKRFVEQVTVNSTSIDGYEREQWVWELTLVLGWVADAWSAAEWSTLQKMCHFQCHAWVCEPATVCAVWTSKQEQKQWTGPDAERACCGEIGHQCHTIISLTMLRQIRVREGLTERNQIKYVTYWPQYHKLRGRAWVLYSLLRDFSDLSEGYKKVISYINILQKPISIELKNCLFFPL